MPPTPSRTYAIVTPLRTSAWYTAKSFGLGAVVTLRSLAAVTQTMTAYETVIGLEVHCELATASKMFCGCPNEFGDEPNTNVCPVCLGLPGSLPVLNGTAVEYALRVAEALHLRVPERSVFSRKNYFYPDMPKDYQTSQYDEPITIDGWLDIDGERVGITRAHLEEDTGKSQHVGRRRPHPRRRLLARRLQPRRRAAARDRVRARHPLGRAGEALRRGAARHAARGRCLRREDGRGLAAHRRQRVGARAGRVRVRHARRDQEPQLAAFAAAGDRLRSRTAVGADRRPARRSCRRRATGTRSRAARSRAVRRKRRTTTATSPSPTSFRSSRRRRCAIACARRCPSCPRAQRARYVEQWGISAEDARVLVDVPGSRPTTRSVRSRR